MIFLLRFKMYLKAAETTPIINNTFGPGTDNKCVYVCSDGSRSLAKETRALKMSVVAGQWKVTMKNWEQSLKLILLKLHEKLPKNSKTTILWSFSIWSELERWKDSISGCLMSWLQKKKKSSFWDVIFSYSVQNNKLSLDQIVKCFDKWNLYNWWWPVQWFDQEEAPKHFPNPNLHQNIGHGHCLVVSCPSGPPQLPEFWQNHYIRDVCSANQWDALKTTMLADRNGQQIGPSSSPRQCLTTCCTPMLPKLNMLGYKALPYLPHSPDLPPANCHFLRHLDKVLQGKMLPQPAGGRRCFPRVCWIPKHRF